MAKYKILILKRDGSELAELTIDALWRSDAVEMAERAWKDAAVQFCGYEVWQGPTKIAGRSTRGG